MYHAEKLPLAVYLLSPPQRKTVQLFAIGDIRKHRLNYLNPVRVAILIFLRIEFFS